MQYYLWTEEQVGTVWVMPKRLLKKNKRELHRFTRFVDEDVVIVDGTAKQVAQQLASGAKVFLMGFRRFALSWKQLPRYVKAVHVDEFHMGFKSANSAQTRALFEAFDIGGMEWFLPMTGTLIEGKLTSAYPAIRIIEPRYYASEKMFEYQHAIRDLDDKIIGWKNHAKLSTIFGRHFIRRTFAQVYGEQEIVHIPEVVEMHPRQREMYDKFHDEAVLDLERFYLDGTQPGVAFIRARQLMEHPNQFPDLTNPGTFFDVMPGDKPAKEELLEIHLADHENTGKPLIIFSSMVPQQRRVADMLGAIGFKYAIINGETPDKVSAQADLDFQDGKINALVCSPQCASVGFNWQFCGDQEVDHMIFMSTDFLDTTYLQARQRAIRGKRNSPLRITTMEYEDSLDQHIFGIIYRKSLDAHKVDPTRPIVQLSAYNKDYTKCADTL
jgi:SNF2 family DNA or RNA helicase